MWDIDISDTPKPQNPKTPKPRECVFQIFRFSQVNLSSPFHLLLGFGRCGPTTPLSTDHSSTVANSVRSIAATDWRRSTRRCRFRHSNIAVPTATNSSHCTVADFSRTVKLPLLSFGRNCNPTPAAGPAGSLCFGLVRQRLATSQLLSHYLCP